MKLFHFTNFSNEMKALLLFIFSPIFFGTPLCEEVLKMEEHEDGWLTVLEKNGLGPAAAIFENYGNY
jgi:hypothetical protein